MSTVTDLRTERAVRRAARRSAQSQLAEFKRLVIAGAAKLAGQGLGELYEVERAQLRAIAGLAGIDMAVLGLDPEADDVRAVGDNLDSIANAVDPLIATIGDTLDSRTGGIDTKLFRDQLRGALEGNSMYEIESAAEAIAEDLRETMGG